MNRFSSLFRTGLAPQPAAQQVSYPCLMPLLMALCMSASLQANELDLRISDDTVHGNFMMDEAGANLRYGLGYFYKDDDDGSANVVNFDLHAKGQTAIANMPTAVAVGFQINSVKINDFKGTGIGLGANVRSNLPDVPGLSLELGAHYAPNVLSFKDIDEFRRLHLQLNYRVIPTADVFAGYQYLNIGIDGGDNSSIESGAFVGLRLNF